MSDAAIELMLSFVIWPYLVVFLVYLHDWIGRILRRIRKEEVTGK